jgi:hypothetical protein
MVFYLFFKVNHIGFNTFQVKISIGNTAYTLKRYYQSGWGYPSRGRGPRKVHWPNHVQRINFCHTFASIGQVAKPAQWSSIFNPYAQ